MNMIELLVIIAFVALAASLFLLFLPRLLDLSDSYRMWVVRQRMRRCALAAAKMLARRKAEFPGCDDAVAMAWPTTGATGNGNAATGQYVANGTATSLLWGTNNILSTTPTGWLTITKISERTIVAFEVPLENGDGLTAGHVLGIDGVLYDIEVRDDTNQVTANLTVGQRIQVNDNGGLVPGGARGAQYSAIICEHDWDAAPKTPAGRKLTAKKFTLIA